MKTKYLEYFIEVARTGSFTEAAENLYITQPALSRIIKSLEDDLSTPLFVRARKKLILTDAGHVLNKHAHLIVKQVDLLKTELNNLLTPKKGHIRIGLPTITNSFFFSELLASFHKEYPEVTFQLEENGSKPIQEKIIDNRLDLGVIVLVDDYDQLDYYSFINETLKLVVPPSHPFVTKQEVSLDELKREKFIMFNQDFELRNLILVACRESGFKPNIISETSQLDFIEEMVASNLGITMLPESTCTELTSDLHTITITNPTIEWNLALIWNKDTYLSQIAKEFIRFAKLKLTKLNDKQSQ
ncbi:LysR family transcriptional regulator [Lederbergia panacisoli]|uniref:LysR family transcriptional regulator n=1 Tax=Lederbergia panacisoli TaxID=1255251 RepID=UPI00214C9D0B|nr:LysR family transcriptional regulator [Lederbergia panacisoli]MCR2823644.1 LysR family transcriptional regulator [Lederbergia panacisoli]